MISIRNALAFGLFLVFSANVSAQRVTFDVEDFSRLDVRGQIDVVILTDPQFSTFAEGRDEVLEALEVMQDGDELRITLPKKSIFSTDSTWRASLVVGLPTLQGLEASRGAEVVARDLTVSDRLNLVSSTGAVITLAGGCQAITVEASTGTVIDAGGLLCVDAEAEARTGAVVQVHASQSIDASATTGAVITVSGAPQKTSQSAKLGGVINID